MAARHHVTYCIVVAARLARSIRGSVNIVAFWLVPRQRDCSDPIASVFSEGVTSLLIGSDGDTSWRGTIDEVPLLGNIREYDRAP
jgi:hypothetical protein